MRILRLRKGKGPPQGCRAGQGRARIQAQVSRTPGCVQVSPVTFSVGRVAPVHESCSGAVGPCPPAALWGGLRWFLENAGAMVGGRLWTLDLAERILA